MHRSFLFVLSLSLLPLSILMGQRTQLTLYVSPDGNDDWSGRLAEPNRSRTDGPFATPERARTAVRRARRDGTLPAGEVVISLRAGTYARAQSMVLTPEDSGTKDAPVVWRAYPGERVSFSGGKTVSGFRPLKDKELLSRLDPAARGNVVATNLKEQGISDFGTIEQRASPGLELFSGGRRLPLARWPNSGWLKVAGVPQTGEKLFNEGLEREKRFDNVPVGRHFGRIAYEGERPKRWKRTDEIFLHGYWTWDWSDSFQRVQAIDTKSREITLAEPHHHYGYTKGQRYYFLNIFEEIDAPGEWYLDRSSGDLFLWPPEPHSTEDVTVSLLEAPFVVLNGTSHLTIEGITFEHARGTGIVITGGTGNRIAGCTFRLLGGNAVVIEGGSENGVQSCDIYDVGLGGIALNGGNRRTLTPGACYAINNHIHHFSRWVRTGQYAITVDGVAAKIAHNVIHDAPHTAIYIRGNEHVIEFNELYRVMQETGDAGAIYSGRDWTWRGNVIRHNYLHDLKGPGLHGVMAVYLDDWASGFTVYGNVFYRAGRAAFIGGGRDNTVENNIFVECEPSVHLDARGLGWAGYYFDGTYPWLFERLEEMNFRVPPYSTRYPELLRLYDDDPRVPKNNKIIRNVSYGGRWMDVYDYWAFDFSVVTVKDNLIASPDILRRRTRGEKGWDPYYLNIDMQEGYVLYRRGDPEGEKEFEGNMFLDGDPGFLDAAGGNFQLRDDSPAYRLGFVRIPMEKIGLYEDEYRRGN